MGDGKICVSLREGPMGIEILVTSGDASTSLVRPWLSLPFKVRRRGQTICDTYKISGQDGFRCQSSTSKTRVGREKSVSQNEPAGPMQKRRVYHNPPTGVCASVHQHGRVRRQLQHQNIPFSVWRGTVASTCNFVYSVETSRHKYVERPGN